MISPLYFGYALIGGSIQLLVIWLMRANGWPFWWVIPGVLLHQYLFTTAYAKAPSFAAQWFLTAAITGLASYGMGVAAFGDRVSLVNVSGIVLILAGLAMLKFG